MSLNTKKIGAFLISLNNAEYRYLEHSIDMRNAIQKLIKTHKLNQKQLCKIFKKSPRTCKAFIAGNYNYSVMDMARLNAAFMELETKALDKKAPVKIAGVNDK